MTTITRIAVIAGCLWLFLSADLWAQYGHPHGEHRIDIGYEVRNLGYTYTPHPYYSGTPGAVRKGFLSASFTGYVTDRFFFSTQAGYLLNNRYAFAHGGPLDFNQGELGADLGIRFDEISLYAGASGGIAWNYRIRGERSDRTIEWMDAASSDNNLTGALRAGFAYHPVSFLTLNGEIARNYYNRDEIRPGIHPSVTPSFNRISFSDYSFSIGISVGFSWRSNRVRSGSGSSPGSHTSAGSASESAGSEGGSGSADSPPTAITASRSGNLSFSLPLSVHRAITSGYGDRRGHQGWDLDLHPGDTVRASAPGTVTRTTRSGNYGIVVDIKHAGGYTTRYAHLSDILVREGQQVGRHQPVGLGGRSGRTTGSHLHFELRKDGRPLDPGRYIEIGR